MPENIEAQDTKQEILFTNFRVHFNDVPIDENGPLKANIITAPDITLNHDQRMFSIEFVALNYNKEVKNRYAYRLVPFENEWNFVDQLNQAVYTNVPSGKYTFEVKTSTYGESSPDEVNRLSIEIKSAFWERLWFQVLTALVFFSIIYLIYKLRVRSLLNSQQELENKVSERTEVIRQQKKDLEQALDILKSTQDQMISQEKMATIGQMTAGIAHEINNPINYISNSTDALVMDISDMQRLVEKILLLEDSNNPEGLKEIIKLRDDIDLAYLNDEMKNLVKGIKEGTQRTSDIIKSLRYLSYKDKPEKEPVNIHDPINSAISILQTKIKDRISVEKDFGSVPIINGYPGELNQVFVNLLSNSIQAIPDKGTIKISTSQQGPDEVLITISDDGAGMTSEVQKKIFEPFFSTKEVGQGTGLGLSITYGIIESHGGKISVDSNIFEGTVFSIVLPVS